MPGGGIPPGLGGDGLEIIIVLLIVAILNGAVAYIDEMLSDLIPMTLHADLYMTREGGGSMVDVPVSYTPLTLPTT